MTTHPLRRYVALPTVPTDAMLLDLALFLWWDTTPGETRDDYARAYQRLQALHPSGRPGCFLVPVDPDEGSLLAIAGLTRFTCDEEDGICPEFEAAYEGYQLMLRNWMTPAPSEASPRTPAMDALRQHAATSERYSFEAVCETIGQALAERPASR